MQLDRQALVQVGEAQRYYWAGRNFLWPVLGTIFGISFSLIMISAGISLFPEPVMRWISIIGGATLSAVSLIGIYAYNSANSKLAEMPGDLHLSMVARALRQHGLIMCMAFDEECGVDRAQTEALTAALRRQGVKAADPWEWVNASTLTDTFLHATKEAVSRLLKESGAKAEYLLWLQPTRGELRMWWGQMLNARGDSVAILAAVSSSDPKTEEKRRQKIENAAQMLLERVVLKILTEPDSAASNVLTLTPPRHGPSCTA